MPEEPRNFARLMARVSTGSRAAASELVERYGAHVLRIVRRRLNQRLRSKFDSSDFVQAVWASLFALPLDRFNFERSDDLVGFLIRLANNKVVEVVRQRLMTQKYDVNRERSLDDVRGREAATLYARQPTPAEIAIAREEWERLLAGQPACYQQILVGLRDGETQHEVAQKVGVSERTVRRVVRKLTRKNDS
jgi:RNA polymerase sigma factor (sigma-70 family)